MKLKKKSIKSIVSISTIYLIFTREITPSVAHIPNTIRSFILSFKCIWNFNFSKFPNQTKCMKYDYKLTENAQTRMQISCLIHDLKLNWLMMIVCGMMYCIVDSKTFVPKLIHEINLGLLLEFIRFLRTTIDVSVKWMADKIYTTHQSRQFSLWCDFI